MARLAEATECFAVRIAREDLRCHHPVRRERGGERFGKGRSAEYGRYRGHTASTRIEGIEHGEVVRRPRRTCAIAAGVCVEWAEVCE